MKSWRLSPQDVVLWPAYSSSSLCCPTESGPTLTRACFIFLLLVLCQVRDPDTSSQEESQTTFMIWLAETGTRRVLFILAKSFVSEAVCSSSQAVLRACHRVAQNEQMTQEVCAGVQFVTAAFLTVSSSSCQQEKKQSLISVKCFDCSISVFVLHCFMQGLDTYYWCLGLLLKDSILKLDTRLL